MAQSNIRSIVFSILFCICFTLMLMLFSMGKQLFPASAERWAYGLLGTAAGLVTTLLFVRIDKIRLADVGVQWHGKTVQRFGQGVLIGALVMGSMAAMVFVLGGLTLQWNSQLSLAQLLMALLPLIPLALMEEIGFRGYALQKLRTALGIRAAIVITALLFGVYHLANGWTWQAAMLSTTVWGLLFAWAACKQQGIAMSTGIHFAANMTTSLYTDATPTFQLWQIQMADGSSMQTYKETWLTAWLPQVALLLLSVWLIERLVKQQKLLTSAQS
jgi:membrane protease YdiL (CAAX protease family)